MDFVRAVRGYVQRTSRPPAVYANSYGDNCVQLHQFCVKCQAIFDSVDVDSLQRTLDEDSVLLLKDWHRTPEEWTSAVVSGCHCCTLLLAEVASPSSPKSYQQLQLKEPFTLTFRLRGAGRDRRISVGVRSERSDTSPLDMESSSASGRPTSFPAGSNASNDGDDTVHRAGAIEEAEVGSLIDVDSIHGSGTLPSTLTFNSEIDNTWILYLQLLLGNIVMRLVRVVYYAIKLAVPTMLQSPEEIHRLAAITTRSTGSSSHLALAKFWFANCLENHARCGLEGRPDSPSRLVKIQRTETGNLRLRLNVAVDAQSTPAYIALSHRWGGGIGINSLTSENVADYQQDIPWDDLPKTFRDASVVAANLGIEHLWIDSLCIMQDSTADFEKEGSKMSSIYGNAVCTIAASGSHNATEGLFHIREPREHLPCRINKGSMKGRQLQRPEMKINHMENWRGFLNHSTLSERCWCFQERLLSPRILYFAQQGIYWECAQGVASEWDQHGLGWRLQDEEKQAYAALGIPGEALSAVDISLSKNEGPESPTRVITTIFGSETIHWEATHHYSFEKREFLRLLKGPRSLDDSGSLFEDEHRSWSGVVYGYSKGALSRDTDKLVALSGITQRLSHGADLQFAYGLLKQSLLLHLLWYTEYPARRRLADVDIPSWSWASINATIFNWICGDFEHLSPDDVLIRRVSLRRDLMKDLTDYRLAVCGKLKQAPLITVQYRQFNIEGFPPTDTRLAIFDPNGKHFLGYFRPDVDPLFGEPGFHVDEQEELAVPDFRGDALWLLPIFSTQYQDESTFPDWAEPKLHTVRFLQRSMSAANKCGICGLALRKKGELFQRSGLFHFDFEEDDTFARHWFDDVKERAIDIE